MGFNFWEKEKTDTLIPKCSANLVWGREAEYQKEGGKRRPAKKRPLGRGNLLNQKRLLPKPEERHLGGGKGLQKKKQERRGRGKEKVDRG